MPRSAAVGMTPRGLVYKGNVTTALAHLRKFYER
jgi:hypothetical protein